MKLLKEIACTCGVCFLAVVCSSQLHTDCTERASCGEVTKVSCREENTKLKRSVHNFNMYKLLSHLLSAFLIEFQIGLLRHLRICQLQQMLQYIARIASVLTLIGGTLSN